MRMPPLEIAAVATDGVLLYGGMGGAHSVSCKNVWTVTVTTPWNCPLPPVDFCLRPPSSRDIPVAAFSLLHPRRRFVLKFSHTFYNPPVNALSFPGPGHWSRKIMHFAEPSVCWWRCCCQGLRMAAPQLCSPTFYSCDDHSAHHVCMYVKFVFLLLF